MFSFLIPVLTPVGTILLPAVVTRTMSFARGFKVKPNKDSSGLPGVNATLYACSVGERAYEWADKEHGVFSYYLVTGPARAVG